MSSAKKLSAEVYPRQERYCIYKNIYKVKDDLPEHAFKTYREDKWSGCKREMSRFIVVLLPIEEEKVC